MSFSTTVPIDQTPATLVVVDCYRFLDVVYHHSGLQDYTEGIYTYEHDSYETAQLSQLNHLLDEVHCTRGSRLLDVGCGAGTLLEEAQKRGAQATGITISPSQAQRCRAKGLDVRVLNYRDALKVWQGEFDGIIANGSMEHFVQVPEAIAGQSYSIYHELFRIYHGLLDETSPARRVATTVIHRAEPLATIDLRAVLQSPFDHPWGSNEFHCAMLERIMGAYPPEIGQLDSSARPYFQAVRTVDGTEDYRKTSEEWLRRALTTLFASRRAFITWKALFPLFLSKPLHTVLSMIGYCVAQSWNWQFRGKNPPMTLLRHTWQAS